MFLLDTSVLVYSTGQDHPLREPAMRLLRDVVDNRIQATTTPEVLQEYAHVRSRRLGRLSASVQAERLAHILDPLTIVQPDHVLEGLRMWSEVPKIGAFDSVVAAVALAKSWTVVSSDQGFGHVPELSWVDLQDY